MLQLFEDYQQNNTHIEAKALYVLLYTNINMKLLVL
jgi:hypothetical protein